MIIPIKMHIRKYKNSFLASFVAFIGTTVELLMNLIAVGALIGLTAAGGFFPGIIFGIIAGFVCIAIGILLKELIFRFSDWIAVRKYNKDIIKQNSRAEDKNSL